VLSSRRSRAVSRSRPEDEPEAAESKEARDGVAEMGGGTAAAARGAGRGPDCGIHCQLSKTKKDGSFTFPPRFEALGEEVAASGDLSPIARLTPWARLLTKLLPLRLGGVVSSSSTSWTDGAALDLPPAKMLQRRLEIWQA
jgi:hypothetical protein